jgi:hypothetical protein
VEGGIETMLDGLLQIDLISATMSNWVISQAMKIYKKEMSNLTTSKESGFHSLTAKMTQEQLQSFDVEDVMRRIMDIARLALTRCAL